MSEDEDSGEYEDDDVERDEDDEDSGEYEEVAVAPPRPQDDATARQTAADRHFRFGWWGLFLFAGLGLVLESLNGLRVDYYMNVANETRRHMFTLAHAHGTLLSLINIAFAVSLVSSFGERIGKVKVASACLLAAMVLLPAGFFTGGLVIYDGDPGLGIMMVPVGALLLVVGSLLVASSRTDD